VICFLGHSAALLQVIEMESVVTYFKGSTSPFAWRNWEQRWKTRSSRYWLPLRDLDPGSPSTRL